MRYTVLIGLVFVLTQSFASDDTTEDNPRKRLHSKVMRIDNLLNPQLPEETDINLRRKKFIMNGNTAFMRFDFKRAIQCFLQSKKIDIEKNEYDPLLAKLLGNTYMEAKRYQDALSLWKEFHQMSKTQHFEISEYNHLQTARSAFHCKEYYMAIDFYGGLLSQNTRLGPNDTVMLALSYYHTNDFKQAERFYDDYLKTSGKTPHLYDHYNLAMIHRKLANRDKFYHNLDQFFIKFPESITSTNIDMCYALLVELHLLKDELSIERMHQLMVNYIYK